MKPNPPLSDNGLSYRIKRKPDQLLIQEPKRVKVIESEPISIAPALPKRAKKRIQKYIPRLPVVSERCLALQYPERILIAVEEIVRGEIEHFTECFRMEKRLVDVAKMVEAAVLKEWKAGVEKFIEKETRRALEVKKVCDGQEAEVLTLKAVEAKMGSILETNPSNEAAIAYALELSRLLALYSSFSCKTHLSNLYRQSKFLQIPPLVLDVPKTQPLDFSSLESACQKQRKLANQRTKKLFAFVDNLNAHLRKIKASKEAEDYRTFQSYWVVIQTDSRTLVDRFLSFGDREG